MKSRLTLPLLVALTVAGYGLGVHGSVPDVPTGQWMPGASFAQPREGAVSVALDDGRLLVIGGRTAAGPVATVESLNSDGSLTALPSMSAPRVGHTAVLLADGSVLVAGGTTVVATDQGTVEAPTASAEIFAPGSNTWSAASPLAVARSGHTATALADGRVLIAGGTGEQGPLDSMEVFEPQEGTFRAAGVLSAARAEAAAAAAGKTQVLVVGGRNADGVLATADLVDVESGAVAPLTLTSPRAGASATRLLDGTVFVAGGNNGANDLATAEVIDPASGAASPAGSMSQPRRGHQATLLDHNATVLIVGGTNNGATVTTADTFVPWTNQFAATNSPSSARSSAIVNSTSTEGVAVLAGGKANSGALVAPAELYGFATVKTDRDDYSPGMFVTITGSGWQPGEVVQMVLHETGPGAEPDLPLIATADAAGRIFNDVVGINEGDVGRRFYLTATGAGATAQVTFTDNQSWAVSPTSTSVTTSSSTSFSFVATNNSTTAVGNDPMACVVITAHPNFTATGTPSVSVPGGLTGWTATRVGNVITAKTNDSSQRLPGAGAQLTVTFEATAPASTSGSPFTFNTAAFGNINCNGGSFPAPTSGQPTVTVTAAANAKISGTVFNDANGNSVLDGAETGISGVTVTRDGTTSTTTDSNGAYEFTGLAAATYSIDYTVPAGFANTGTKPRSVTVAAGASSTGNNFFAAPQYTVTFQQSGMGNDTGAATIVTVNGTPYAAASMPTLTFTAGQSVTYAFATQVTSTLTGKRYALTTPAPAPSSPFNVSGNTTVTGTYKTQYEVTFAQSGIGGDSTGTIVTVAGAAKTTLPFTTDWLDSGADLTYSYETLVASTNSSKRYALTTPDPTPATPISVTSPLTVTGTYKTQYELTFTQSGMSGDSTGTVVTVAGSPQTEAVLSFKDWFDNGSPVSYTFSSLVATTTTGKRYALTTPDPSPASPFNVSGPATITGTYKTQYEVKFEQSGIGGDSIGTIVTVNLSAKTTLPFSDWFDSGAPMDYTYATMVASTTSGKRYALTTPDPSPASPFNVSGPVTITGTYKTQFQVTFAQSGIGTPAIASSSPVVKVAGVDKYIGDLAFSPWYDQNASVAYSFDSPISTDPVSDKQYELTNGASLPSSPLSVTGPMTITGQYTLNTYSILYHQPIDQSSSSSMESVNSGKNGRVIPVKIEFFKNGTPVQTGTVLMKVNPWSCNGSAPVDPVSEYADAGNSNANTNLFRWTAGSPGFWIYNLDTGGLGLKTNACYRLDVYLNATTGSTAVKLSSTVYAVFKPVK